jgi:hypothetical protein
MDLCTEISAACWFECVHGRLYRPNIQTNRLLQVLCTNPSTTKSHVDELRTVLLHTGDDKNVEQLFYVADGSVGPITYRS